MNAQLQGATDAPDVHSLDWSRITDDLDARGNALVPGLLSSAQCDEMAAMYPRDTLFRSRVVMGRHGFGRGEYKYFAYPLPDLVAGLREAFYPQLVPIANRWNQAMGIDVRYPDHHAEFIERCHRAGGRCGEPAAATGSACATASAVSDRGIGTPWA